ncbi:MAG: S-methyl-5'-thioadenosine phosphorylase [Acidobacteriota bacterium]
MSERDLGDGAQHETRIGILGGSGLYAMAALEVHEERHLTTPFGEPSGPYVLGSIEGVGVAFLARHGAGHRLMPSELNFRANIFGFKTLGVERLLSVSAVGSMRERYAPRHIVVPDQMIDRTRHRPDTFFGDGMVAHVGFADPVCPRLAETMTAAARSVGATVHAGGTYVCMEGPQFSTRAESNLYRSWGVDVIGMTNLQEAKLAREAEICYATYAMVTDYDCWHESEEDVSVEGVVAILQENSRVGQQAVAEAVRRLADGGLEPPSGCPCCDALRFAIITDPSVIPASTLRKLEPIVGRYFPPPTADS